MMESQPSPYARLVSALPEQVQHAAEICSIPHWVDDELARTLVSKFANLNGKTDAAVGHLKSLPIVYPYENRGWRVTNEVRTFLQERVSRNGLHQEISEFLAGEFDSQLESLHNNSPAERELQWRTAFHLAPVDPEESIERLDSFVIYIDETELADLKAAVDLWEEQERWLSSYEAEMAYFRGRYAYALEQWESAQKWLQITWESGRNTRRKAIAGHLLGAMLRRRGESEDLREAEETLRASIDLSKQLGEKYCESHASNTLAATLRELGGEMHLKEAAEHASRSLEIGEAIGHSRIEAYASVTLASVLRDLDADEHRDRIRELLDRAADIGERHGLSETVLMARDVEAQVLRQLGGEEQLREAEEMLRETIDRAERLGDEELESRASNTLAATLRKRGRLEEAAEHARRSLEVAEAAGHPETEAQASVTLASVLWDLDVVEHQDRIRDLLDRADDLNEQHELADLVLPSLADFHESLGTALMEKGESHFQEAEEELRRAQDLASEDRSVSEHLQRLRDMRRAIASREKGEMEAENPKEYYNLGKAYESDGDRDKAIKCFRSAIELGYEEPIVFSKLGQLLAIDDEHREEAKELLEDAIDRGLRDTQTLRSLARTLQKLGHLSEAETYFNEALNKNEKNDEYTDIKLLHWYGLFLLEKKDYEGAYSFLRQAFELDKSNPYFANDVGRVILEADWREKFSEARKLFKRAIELSDKDFKWPRRYLSELENLE